MRSLQVILVLFFLAACHSSLRTAKEQTIGITREEHESGKKLFVESDCMTCHHVEQRMTGPAFGQIAKRYSATNTAIERLANKIIKGGSGNWGQVPMTPHDDLNKKEAILLVKYVLTVNSFKQQ